MNGDDWRCLHCDCTFESGCRLEAATNETLALRRRYIPPRRLPAPPIPHYKRDRVGTNAYNREQYRKRIEAVGGTVRPRK